MGENTQLPWKVVAPADGAITIYSADDKYVATVGWTRNPGDYERKMADAKLIVRSVNEEPDAPGKEA